MIDYRERLTPVLRALEQDPDLSIEALASRACLSLYHFHRVFTAVALWRDGSISERLVETRLRFRRLSSADMRAYLMSGEWQGKAGGYAIQGLAGAFVATLSGSYPAVVGLPLLETASLPEGAGYAVTAAWAEGGRL